MELCKQKKKLGTFEFNEILNSMKFVHTSATNIRIVIANQKLMFLHDFIRVFFFFPIFCVMELEFWFHQNIFTILASFG